MAAEGRNLLEVVLNTDIAKKFNAVDDAVDKIQASMNSAAESAKQFADALEGINKSFGDKSGFASFAENIQKLIESLNGLNANAGAKGIEQTTKEISNLGDVSKSNIDLVNKLVEALNKIGTVSPTTDLAGYATEKAQLTLKKLNDEIDTLKDKLFKTGVSREEEQALVDQLDVLKEIVKLRSESTQEKKKKEDAEAEKAEAKALKEKAEAEKAYIKHLKEEQDAKALRFKDAQDAYKQETKALQEQAKEGERIREDANKRRRAEIKQAFQEEAEAEKKSIDERKAAEKEISSLFEQRLKLQEKQKNIQLKYTEEENTKGRASKLKSLKDEYDGLGRSINEINAKLKAFEANYKVIVAKGERLYSKEGLEIQTRYLEQYQAIMMKVSEAEQEENKRMLSRQKAEELQNEINLLKEYTDLLRKQDELEKKREPLRAKIATTGLSQDELSYYTEINSLIAQNNKRMDELAQSSANVASYEAKRVYSGEQAVKQKEIELKLNDAIKNQEQKNAKTAEDELNLLEQQIKARQDLARAQSETFSGAMGYSQRAKNIEQERQAIEYLKAARDKLNYSDKDYESKLSQLNQRIRQHEENIKRATGATAQFRQENIKLNNVLQQVAGAFGVYLGVQGLVNFAKNVATTTGEFELQHRALQAIIGDIDQANKLWDKTVRLAVRSPFSVKELVTYTKQLAAYRVETEKLYDTTKMLADISSGLGVDMQRLILAYGQVKAANYLRGQELRQFSEAGINILGELAKYFEEIKGQAVSTGDVFEMVSKRMVKFEDVAEVLKRLTQEGGTFFNMQEIQAETLQGMMTNLKDSFDIMKNEIGESNRGIIVAFVQTAKYLADNWKTVGNTLKWVSGLVIALNIAMKSARISFMSTQAVANGTTIQMTLLTRVLALFNPTIRQAALGARAFSAAMGSIPGVGIVLAVLTALTGVITSLVGKMRMAKEYQEEISRINSQTALETSKMTNQYAELANKIKNTNTSEKERAELLSKMKRLYGEILPSHMLEIEYITKEGNAYEDALQGIRAYYEEKRKQKEIEATEKQYGESVDTNQASAAKRLQKQIELHTGIKVSIKEINSILEELSQQLRDGKIEADKFEESLAHLIKIQTGIDLESYDIQTMTTRFRIMSTVYENVREYLESILDYDKQIQEVTSSGEFGGVMANAFETLVTKPAENAIAEYSQHLKGTFVEQGDELAKYTEDAFNHYWEEFKKSPYYRDNPDLQTYFDNLFSQKITPKINASKITDQIRGIRKMFDDAAEQIKVSNKGIFKDFLYDGKNTTKEYLEDLKKQLDARQLEKREIEGGIRIAKPEELKQLNEEISVLEIVVKLLDAIYNPNKKNGSQGNQALQLLNKQIEAIKNATKQYDEYKKLYDDTSAFDKTKEAVKGLFNELNIGNLLDKSDVFNEEAQLDEKSGIKKWLSASIAAAGKAGNQAAEKYLRELRLRFDQEDFKKDLEGMKNEMEKAFADYDMFKELGKLGIGKDFASLLFGVQTNDLKQLRDKLAEQAKNLQNSLGEAYSGSDAQKAIQEMNKKIDDIEDKEQKERLKKYVEYTKQAMTERARIEVDGLQEIYEIEKTFQKEIKKAEDDNNEERAKQIKQLMDAAVEGSTRATNEKLQKQAWEDFKGSDMYVEMFNDIGNASTRVIEAIQEKIGELRKSLKDLNPSDLKAITQEITKLEDELIKRNPAKAYFDLFKQVKKLQSEGKDEDSLMQQMGANDAEIENLNDQIAGFERLIEKRKQFNQEQIDSEGKDSYIKMNMSLQAQVEQWKKLIDQKKKDNAITAEELATYKRFRNASQEFANYLQNMGGRVASIFSDIMSNLEAFGGETTNTSEAWGDLFSSMMSIIATIPNYILLMKAAGVATNEAFGVVGWIITAVEVLVALIKGIANIRNAAIDDEIERYKNQVDDLSDKYDRLEKKFDSVWDIDRLRQYNNDMRSYMEQQIGYYEKMIKAEQSRKSPDQSVIDEYNRTINDLYDQIEERHDEWLEKVSGFGGESSWGDATQGFIDAWYDAFAETGDGLEGLKENFNEVIVNMVKKQAALRLANAILEPLYKKINEAANDGTITNSEMDAIVAKANATFPELNEKLKAFFQSLGVFGEQAKGELDGLQKGIQGVTEQTAEIIAAYMNSIRYYVIDNNTKLGQIISSLQDSTGTFNPMVAELRNIRQQAEDIRNLLFSWRETGGVPSMRVTIV